MHSRSRDLFKYWEITDNISETGISYMETNTKSYVAN